MNDKDIKLFAKLFIQGTRITNIEQTSREPITLHETVGHSADGLFDRFNITECSLEEIENDLIQKLTSFNNQVNKIRESDNKFSKIQLAEDKRQKKIVKELQKTLKK